MSALVPSSWRRILIGASTALLMATGLVLTTSSGTLAPSASASTDAFGVYTGNIPLAQIPPGTVLKTRVVTDHLAGIPLPVTAIQLLYRSTGTLGQPTVNITSVLEPLIKTSNSKVVSAQSAYDSLNPADEPSAEIFGDAALTGTASNDTLGFGAPFLLAGYSVIVPDTEGQDADFAIGPLEGMNTLDSIRAAMNSPLTGIASNATVAMIGASGGAIGTEWAAQMAPSYAPDVNRHLVGAAEAGLLVDPAHNISYINGTVFWSDVMPMVLAAARRAYNIDFSPYLSPFGASLLSQVQNQSIVNAMGRNPFLTWASLVKPAYANPDSIPAFVDVANKLNLGLQPTPTVPMYMAEGTLGIIEGTPDGGPGIGSGDGVMVAGDSRTLARKFCQAGTAVTYTEYPLDHGGSIGLWAGQAELWVMNRLRGAPVSDNCSTIPAGNSLTPETPTTPGP